jgi:hypothetical protein
MSGFQIDFKRNELTLGLGENKPKTKYVCFLPFRGEFGWYIVLFVKRVQGYNHENKIVCAKKGHECLFPTANHFHYDWQDIPDHHKAGISEMQDEESIKKQIIEKYKTEDITFLSPSETSWNEKLSYHKNVFVPQAKSNNNLVVDAVICPRNRKMDSHRNWTHQGWHDFITQLNNNGLSVGVCGNKETSFELDNAKYKSYNYIDVDSDVEMMSKARIVIAQESGLLYLSYLCKRPTVVLGWNMEESKLHRDETVPFANVDESQLNQTVINYLKYSQLTYAI